MKRGSEDPDPRKGGRKRNSPEDAVEFRDRGSTPERQPRLGAGVNMQYLLQNAGRDENGTGKLSKQITGMFHLRSFSAEPDTLHSLFCLTSFSRCCFRC
jgi:hypothetical protein